MISWKEFKDHAETELRKLDATEDIWISFVDFGDYIRAENLDIDVVKSDS